MRWQLIILAVARFRVRAVDMYHQSCGACETLIPPSPVSFSRALCRITRARSLARV